MKSYAPGSSARFLAVSETEFRHALSARTSCTPNEVFEQLRVLHIADDYLDLDDVWQWLCECFLPQISNPSSHQEILACGLTGVQTVLAEGSMTLSWVSRMMVGRILSELLLVDRQEFDAVFESRYENDSEAELAAYANEAWTGLEYLAAFYARADQIDMGILILTASPDARTSRNGEPAHDFALATDQVIKVPRPEQSAIRTRRSRKE